MFTDYSLKHPTISAAFGILLVVLGGMAFQSLQLKQFPDINTQEVDVVTLYHGASAENIANFVSQPIEKAIGSVSAVDYVTSKNTQGKSYVKAHLRYGYKAQDWLAEIAGEVSKIQSSLPKGAYPPSVVRGVPSQYYDIVVSFSSDTMSVSQLTAFVENKIKPKVYSVGDIAELVVAGGSKPSLKVDLSVDKLMAMNVSTNDVVHALLSNNTQPKAGQIRSMDYINNILLSSNLHVPKDFNDIPILQTDGSRTRVGDVADVTFGEEIQTSSTLNNGKETILLLVIAQSDVLGVTKSIRDLVNNLRPDLPDGVEVEVAYDARNAIVNAISGVFWAVLQAIGIVLVVLWVFLGSLRAVLPAFFAIPLSICGVLVALSVLGYSLNMITLLAVILSVSLVVDDAIIVTENIFRYIKQDGMKKIDACLKGIREIASPIIVMTFTLVSVFMPLALTKGPTATVFSQFVFTLMFAVITSASIALFISPTVCLVSMRNFVIKDSYFNRVFDSHVVFFFRKFVGACISMSRHILLFSCMLLVFIIMFAMSSKSEFVPAEDLGWYLTITHLDKNDGLKSLEQSNAEIERLQASPYTVNNLVLNGQGGSSSIMGIVSLTDWSKRPSIFSILPSVYGKNLKNPYQTTIINPPSIPGAPYPMIKVILTSQKDLDSLLYTAKNIESRLKSTKQFIYTDLSVKDNKLILDVDIDRVQAYALNIPIERINEAIFTATSPTEIDYFSIYNYVYKIIPLLQRNELRSFSDLEGIFVSNLEGKRYPLSSVVNVRYSNIPNHIEHYQQQNSVTLTLMQLPVLSIGEALETVDSVLKNDLPSGYDYYYIDLAKRLKDSSSTFALSFLLSMFFVYLALVAQFNSFLYPLVILVTVPVCAVGALIPIVLEMITLNIYSQIAMITLVGIMTKIGILIVQFANNLRENEGLSARDAVLEASCIRLKPILMTTFALLFGVLPLIFSTGSGAVSCLSIGLVIFWGALMGTLLTFMILPVFYCLFSDMRARYLTHNA